MKALRAFLFNYLLRKIYGENLSYSVQRFIIDYNEPAGQFIMTTHSDPLAPGKFYNYIYVDYPERDPKKPIHKFTYSIKDGTINIKS